MQGYNYQFVALRGMQAGREYYVAMCPIKLIPKIFLFDEEELPAELRAQRVLNKSRVPDIARYLINNPTDYIFSSLTASIDGKVNFAPIENSGLGRNVGTLTIPMGSSFLINDGQHRRAAIDEALKVNPELGDETISVVFFIDAGLKRSQQQFADLNKHAVRPTRSIGILYDHRDPFARLICDMIEIVPIFHGMTETEKTTISNRSPKLFTLSGIYQATQALLGKRKKDAVEAGDSETATAYWTHLGTVIPEWRQAINKDVASSNLRKEYVHVHGVTLQALGIVGRVLMDEHPRSWKKKVAPLADINWLRTNPEWHGRAIQRGRMSKQRDSIILTANHIKQKLGIPLSDNDMVVEQRMEILT